MNISKFISKKLSILSILFAQAAWRQKKTLVVAFLLVAFSVCSAESVEQTVKDTVNISSSSSVAVNELHKSPENDSYDRFLTIVSISIAIISVLIAIIVGFWVHFNFKMPLVDLKKEMKKEFEKILEDDRKSLNRSIAEFYYLFAEDGYGKKQWYQHFMNLADFYITVNEIKEFSKKELAFLEMSEKFISGYEEQKDDIIKLGHSAISRFSVVFLHFMENREKKKTNQDVYKKAKIRCSKFFKIFTDDEMRKLLEDYGRESDSYDNNIDETIKLINKYRVLVYGDSYEKK
ncbi:MAG: hypothetical protein FWC26_10350 [Fibromonadales bacterium]|nr:hypothetical protein [Fibromonadales bacterium]